MFNPINSFINTDEIVHLRLNFYNRLAKITYGYLQGEKGAAKFIF